MNIEELKKKIGPKLVEMAVDYLRCGGGEYHVWHLRLGPKGKAFWHTLLAERYAGVAEPIYKGEETDAEFYGGFSVFRLFGSASEWAEYQLDGKPALTKTGRASLALREHLIEYELHNALCEHERELAEELGLQLCGDES